jgi:hypothetical protein
MGSRLIPEAAPISAMLALAGQRRDSIAKLEAATRDPRQNPLNVLRQPGNLGRGYDPATAAEVRRTAPRAPSACTLK